MYSENNNVQQSIFLFLMYNQEHFKNRVAPFKSQKETLLNNEDSSFHEEIKEQYESFVRKMIVDEVTGHLAISTEDAIIMIEDLNLNEYLGV